MRSRPAGENTRKNISRLASTDTTVCPRWRSQPARRGAAAYGVLRSTAGGMTIAFLSAITLSVAALRSSLGQRLRCSRQFLKQLERVPVGLRGDDLAALDLIQRHTSPGDSLVRRWNSKQRSSLRSGRHPSRRDLVTFGDDILDLQREIRERRVEELG